MDDKSYIRLVNTHTEGDSRHDDIDTLHQEVVLSLRTGCRIQTCMIRSSLDIVCLEYFSQFFHLFSGQTIDDATLTWMLTDKHDNLAIDVVGFLAHLVEEIRTVEGTLEFSGIHDAEVFLDVCTHLVGSRCRKGNDRCLAYFVDDRAYASVLWAEIMSPLRDTVCLIHGIERDFDGLQELYIIFLGQRFRCHIEELGLATQYVALHLLDGRFVQR